MNVKKAKKLAKKLYKGKKRLSGESYLDHVLDIIKRLKKYGIKEEHTIITAWLHHAFDRSPSQIRETKEELLENLGEEVTALLEKYHQLTDTKISTNSLRQENEKYLIQAFVNLVEDIRVIVVRLVDKVHDLENSWVFDREKQKDKALRALYFYAPLAKILGVTNIGKDLEDTAFKILYPDEYFNLKQKVKKRSWGTKKIFREVEKFLKETLEEQGLSNFEIKYRAKSLYSLHKKVERYRKGNTFVGENLEGIYDLFALRVIVNTVEECYLVENLLLQLWEAVPGERDDYIKKPRSTGYQSIHNAFKIEKDFVAEVQIRTHEMHTQAEYGISSHLLYKIGDKGEKSQAVEEFKKYLKTHPDWFRDLNFWEIEKKNGYKPQTPFSDRVYVFTPKGDIIELPRGATVVDFAYAVHSEVGDHCAGAFVNNKIVKLDRELNTGDTVKIRVDKRKRLPSRDWLDFVKTRRAKIWINKAWRQ